MLVFGWRTALMALAGAQLVLLALALLTAERNRTANRLLAAMLIVLVGLLTPYGIGFAGFYDLWPWLSFAPLAMPLALGPLLWGYTRALTAGAAPKHFAVHLAPAMAHFVYSAICFSLPLAAKHSWAIEVHDIWIEPLISAATLIGLSAYCLAAFALLRRYRAALDGERSDAPRYAARWLSRAIAAMLIALIAWGGYQAAELALGRFDYFQMFGLYLVLGAVGLYLAIEGWRHAGLAFPPLLAVADRPAEEPAAPVASGRDWAASGAKWAAETEAGGWWRDDGLSLSTLAAHLGTNTSYLSRALNEGLSQNFASFVNALRADAVAAALRAGDTGDLLTLALDNGFASKASFNRAFRARFGLSPSDFRKENGSKDKVPAESRVLERAAE